MSPQLPDTAHNFQRLLGDADKIETLKTYGPSIYVCSIGLCYATNGLRVFKKLLGAKAYQTTFIREIEFNDC